MSDHELILRNKVAGDEPREGIAAAVALCTVFLFAKEAFEEAELILLEKVGLQSLQDGYVIELTLGDLYIRMKENSRAARFLTVAGTSPNEAIRQQANNLMAKLREDSPKNE